MTSNQVPTAIKELGLDTSDERVKGMLTHLAFAGMERDFDLTQMPKEGVMALVRAYRKATAEVGETMEKAGPAKINPDLHIGSLATIVDEPAEAAWDQVTNAMADVVALSKVDPTGLARKRQGPESPALDAAGEYYADLGDISQETRSRRRRNLRGLSEIPADNSEAGKRGRSTKLNQLAANAKAAGRIKNFNPGVGGNPPSITHWTEKELADRQPADGADNGAL